MPLVEKTLETQINAIVSKAGKDAFKETLKASFKEGMSVDELNNAMAEKFGKKLASSMSKDLATAITNYIKSATLIPILANSGGAVSGTITIT